MYLFSIFFAQPNECQIQLDSIKDKVGKHGIPNNVLTSYYWGTLMENRISGIFWEASENAY